MAGMGLMKKIRKMTGKKGIKKNIGQGLVDHIDKLAKMIAKGNRNEEETRRWVIDVLVDAFGYHPDQLETEMKALGKRVDIAITSKGKVLMVIECKASNVELKQAAVNQAANYATSLGAEWAAVTNGRAWKLYHVNPKSGAEADLVEILDVGLLDDDGISKDDIDALFMMTEQSLVSGDTMKEFHFNNCTSEERIINALISTPLLKALHDEIVNSYRLEFGVDVMGVQDGFLQHMVAYLLDVELTDDV